jgi:alpha-amylase
MKNLIFTLILISNQVNFLLAQDKNLSNPSELLLIPKSDVFMQAFYWNSPPGGIWYDSLSRLSTRLASAGFGAIWIPPAAKGAGAFSMGYDVYDFYDFGQLNQKGSIETRFGSKAELKNMVAKFKSVGVQLFFDAVLNHTGNGDEKGIYQCGTNDSGYVIFNPLSGRFPRTAANFHPNNIHCDRHPPYHNNMFFEDFCHYAVGTGDSLIAWCRFIKDSLGFNGFRIDAIKHIEPHWIALFSQAFPNTYIVGENWSGIGEIIDYYNQVTANGGNISLFDFPLRYTLKDMCNNTSGSFDMNSLYSAGLINSGMNPFAVATFVENHDFDRQGWNGQIDPGHDPVLTNKDMGYSYIIFSEGRPSVFFKDYFDYGLAGKIDTLIWIRQKFLFGNTTQGIGLNPWYLGSGSQQELSRDLFVSRRNGGGGKPQSFLLINDHPTQWRGVWVNSNHPNQWFKDYTGRAINKQAAADGRVELWAPPRSYAIYVPDTTQIINYPPVLEKVPDLITYTNAPFRYQLRALDANNTQLNFSMLGNPTWLTLSSNGLLSGIPVFADTGISQIIIQVSDSFGSIDRDTFFLSVKFNLPPNINPLNDTTIRATYRFEKYITATDPNNDTLIFNFRIAPNWLNLDSLSGLIVGTPSINDTGIYNIKISVTDNKGGFDSTAFILSVIKPPDSVIFGYGKPTIDGNINLGTNDWIENWRIVLDSNSDSQWRTPDSLDNEMLGIYATWDADSLYLGIDYVINDSYNTLMLYIDAGKQGGVTNFHSNSYVGEYQKNFRFRESDGIDCFVATYYLNQPSFYLIDGNNSVNKSSEINRKRGQNARGAELAIAWNTIYGMGTGLLPPNVVLKVVGVVAGGFNWGAGDSAPDNPDVNGDSGPDSLIFLAFVYPDTNGNGIPDPTLIITSLDEATNEFIPEEFYLYQNYPNPFNPLTTISYQIKEQGLVQLKVYNSLGQEIVTLVNEVQSSGIYKSLFDASNLPSGVYFYRMISGSYSETKKMILLR